MCDLQKKINSSFMVIWELENIPRHQDFLAQPASAATFVLREWGKYIPEQNLGDG